MLAIIIDTQTKLQVGKPYTDTSKARRKAEKLDLQYGAYRYIVKFIPGPQNV